MFSRAFLLLVAASSLLVALTGCSALTRPDEITIQAEPVGAAAKAAPEGAAQAPGAAAQPTPNGAPKPAGTG